MPLSGIYGDSYAVALAKVDELSALRADVLKLRERMAGLDRGDSLGWSIGALDDAAADIQGLVNEAKDEVNSLRPHFKHSTAA